MIGLDGVHFVLGSPNAYIHEPGILHRAGEWIGKYGKSVFIVTGTQSWMSCGGVLQASLEQSGISCTIEPYRGECSYEEVARLRELLPGDAELICGVGGGKVMDTAKALANSAGRPFVAVPTIAATCAAVANLSIMYTQEGVYIDFPVYNRGTLLCLVDTEVIAAAPVRYLGAGIADTLAKWIEAPVSAAGKERNLPVTGGLMAAKLCYDTLLEYSAQAMDDARQGRASAALRQVIDANILFSGMVGGLGEDQCRSAAAHAIHNGLTVLPDTHGAYHGEKVAYGILVQLVLEKRPMEEIAQVLRFYRTIGLPSKLKHLGVDCHLSGEELRAVAEVSLSNEGTMGNMPFVVTSDMILAAIHVVEHEL